MVKIAEAAFSDADVILLLLDVSQQPERADEYIAETVARLRGRTPVVLALNKADLLTPDNHDANIAAHEALIPHDQAFTLSALTGEGVDDLLNDLIEQAADGTALLSPPKN